MTTLNLIINNEVVGAATIPDGAMTALSDYAASAGRTVNDLMLEGLNRIIQDAVSSFPPSNLVQARQAVVEAGLTLETAKASFNATPIAVQ